MFCSCLFPLGVRVWRELSDYLHVVFFMHVLHSSARVKSWEAWTFVLLVYSLPMFCEPKINQPCPTFNFFFLCLLIRFEQKSTPNRNKSLLPNPSSAMIVLKLLPYMTSFIADFLFQSRRVVLFPFVGCREGRCLGYEGTTDSFRGLPKT